MYEANLISQKMITRSAAKTMNNVHIFHNVVEMSKHVSPLGFPERPTRLVGIECAIVPLMDNVKSHLVTELVDKNILNAEYGTDEVLRWEMACNSAISSPVMDTVCGDIYWSKDTMTAVRIAVSASRSAVQTVLAAAAIGHIEYAFAIVRPPGHHCYDVPSGFCIVNNIVLATRVALAAGKRVAIVDWDYHFGDGTATEFLETKAVTFCSLHCEKDRRGNDTYPHSYIKGDNLTKRTNGRMFNIQWEKDDADNSAYNYAFERVVIPAFNRFKPDIILVSAGYDALRGDSLAGMELTPEIFYDLTIKLKKLGVPIVCVLEGGYDPNLLGRGVYETLNGLLAPNTREGVLDYNAAPHHIAVVDAIASALKL
jgi:acetoin utilization deacetylase AcuC-like enzyme